MEQTTLEVIFANKALCGSLLVIGWLLGPQVHKLARWGLKELETWLGRITKKD